MPIEILMLIVGNPPPPPPPASRSTATFDAPPAAYLASDDSLLSARYRSAGRGYNRDDVHRAGDAMRHRIVELRAQLERQRQVQLRAHVVVASAEERAQQVLDAAIAQANAVVTNANITAEKLLAETKHACDRATQHGVRSAFEMANLLGYEPGEPHELMGAIGQTRRSGKLGIHDGEPDEQQAFDEFFNVADEDSKALRWMTAS